MGASNTKWQYFIANWNTHMAHVEAVEKGTHSILIANQTGCTVGRIWIDNVPTLACLHLSQVDDGPEV